MDTKEPSTFRPRYTKFGLAEDYTGAHVLTIDNRLATIDKIYFRELPAAFMATLRYFNGDLLGDQAISSLRILNRQAV